MTPARARALLKAMRGGRVLVLGDVMLDEFIWGNVARISPEAPVPVVQVTGHGFHLGGAGNVAANVRSLGGSAALAGVIGEDAAGEHVRSALARAGVEPLLLVASGGRPTTVKTRIIAHHQQVVRADREHTGEISSRLQSLLYDSARRALGSCQALVVSDYQKGVVTASLMQRLLQLARRRHIPVLVDPKVGHFARYRRATLVTPNQLEAEQATGLPIRSPGDLLAVGRRILSMLGCDAALITRGERGMSLFERGRRPTHIPTAAREVFDVTGAGDTVIATLALALSAGARLAEAAVLANYAAGVVVGKLGTAQATPDELLAAVERPVRPKASARAS
jgi:D-glycero-beta-D-manno-heptose-7-phosphate kinase